MAGGSGVDGDRRCARSPDAIAHCSGAVRSAFANENPATWAGSRCVSTARYFFGAASVVGAWPACSALLLSALALRRGFLVGLCLGLGFLVRGRFVGLGLVGGSLVGLGLVASLSALACLVRRRLGVLVGFGLCLGVLFLRRLVCLGRLVGFGCLVARCRLVVLGRSWRFGGLFGLRRRGAARPSAVQPPQLAAAGAALASRA